MMSNLPPVIPDVKEILEDYLSDIESLPIHDSKHSQKYLPVYPEPLKLLSTSLSPLTSYLEVMRDLATGAITGVKESYNRDLGSTAKDSFSLRRLPGPPEEMVRGSSANYPFWPGGIPEPQFNDIQLDDDIFNPANYFVKHPKLSRGLDVNHVKVESNKEEKKQSENSTLNLADVLQVDVSELKIFDQEAKVSVSTMPKTLKILSSDEEAPVESVLEPDATVSKDVIKISLPTKQVIEGTEWAIVVNTDTAVDDFDAKVPNPACSYPFELDTFQKQAVLHLENKENVFVAAHTSAGKTVVAEYCIALSMKHSTRAIYTSPIKALSNQKYHDLKVKFEDVGLLTGDIQINSKASCLIMTTEILQSMLYNGSDLIRDLEWVIFDEVHYINNAERGHVWEEVIIMLPSHVHIVLLSATVPNTVEFADWIGRIKKTKIYVISTSKRPVPLEHYLYTGSGGKSKNERFLILNSSEKFVVKGYNDAVEAKKERGTKSHKMTGPKNKAYISINPKQEMNTWIGLLDHLSQRELLPVVAFTLSKKRCDSNAMLLTSQDLTTKMEKGEINSFISKCIERLPRSDKVLRQVIQMKELLKKGIGIHHSGILPILKEVVEMLFSKGLVKLLFATETFAMGVNMPARSVVFDSIRKHDGFNFRVLLPSEYIQMAGRAGRRGKDTTGTVIILCKNDVPDLIDLQLMMLGKPNKLESQFKLTYSMILNLLKIQYLSVEDMMKRSFSETFMINLSKYEIQLKNMEEELEKAEKCECLICEDMDNFYAVSRDYIDMRQEFLKLALTHPTVRKKLQPGRLITISYRVYQNYLACLLNMTDTKCTVFILKNASLEDSISNNDVMALCLSCIEDSFSIIESSTTDHKVLQIDINDIIGISSKIINVDSDRIIKDVREREIPRFKDNPPKQAVRDILVELQRIMESQTLELISFKDYGIKDISVHGLLTNIESQRKKLGNQKCLECPQFKEHFAVAYKRLKTSEEVNRLKYLMSEEALLLHPEYEMRIEVLKRLGYIEGDNAVTLKGKVACEMGNHELMVTELIYENVIAEKPIEEIAALISSLVFQQRICSEPSLTASLKKGVEEFKSVASKIGETQKECGIKEAVGDYVEQFNFGLCEVVYQWALGLPFDKIIELTDVQEGVIVKCIQRLDETLKDFRKAAIIIGGDSAIREKMEEASVAIKRDIVFAASLYTQ